MSDEQRRADIAAIIARSVQRLRDAACDVEPEDDSETTCDQVPSETAAEPCGEPLATEASR
jgi:hypothetical protein